MQLCETQGSSVAGTSWSAERMERWVDILQIASHFSCPPISYLYSFFLIEDDKFGGDDAKLVFIRYFLMHYSWELSPKSCQGLAGKCIDKTVPVRTVTILSLTITNHYWTTNNSTTLILMHNHPDQQESRPWLTFIGLIQNMGEFLMETSLPTRFP